MNYRLLLLIPFINMPLLGKCACHENQPPVIAVKPSVEPAIAPIDPVVTLAQPPTPISEPIIIPNATSEPTISGHELAPTETPVPEARKEQGDNEDLRTTIQRAAVLCAAIGVVGLILYKATSNSPLERAVSALERRAAAR